MTTNKAEEFYAEVLKILKRTRIPFLVGGTFAVNAYIGSDRPTKDLDIFCKASDYPRILAVMKGKGYKTGVEDERWIAKILKGKHYLDVVFNAGNAVTPITDEWFRLSRPARILGLNVKLLPPTELIVSKVFVQDRYKYDGCDIAHIVLVMHRSINWKRLLRYLDQYWEVLLIHLLNFRFMYPAERRRVPLWLFKELLTRLERQIDLPVSYTRVCRGRLFSRSDYAIDITQWGFADVVGGQNEHKGN